MIFGFFVMWNSGLPHLHRVHADAGKVVTPSGQVVFTSDEITRGQEIFQARGIQEYGSIVGHGAYLGPDYTADYPPSDGRRRRAIPD